jgi:ubiquinone/menaquinone biosynthesis C-methylase UbiE
VVLIWIRASASTLRTHQHAGEDDVLLPISPAGRDATDRRGRLRDVSRFLRLNFRLSAAVQARLQDNSTNLYRRYDEVVARSVPRSPDAVVVDVGGGRGCSFVHHLPARASRARIVAVDVSPEELASNRDVDETRVADIVHGLPFEDGQVQLIASRTTLEHVPDVDAFFRHAARVLAPGGLAIHLIPSRYSLFAIAARLLPFGPTKALLHRLYPWTKEVVEFPVFYDRCYPSGIEESLERHGFRDVRIEVSYNQTGYFAAFFPAYLLCVLYESIVRRLGLRNLAAYMLVVAEKVPSCRSA